MQNYLHNLRMLFCVGWSMQIECSVRNTGRRKCCRITDWEIKNPWAKTRPIT